MAEEFRTGLDFCFGLVCVFLAKPNSDARAASSAFVACWLFDFLRFYILFWECLVFFNEFEWFHYLCFSVIARDVL